MEIAAAAGETFSGPVATFTGIDIDSLDKYRAWITWGDGVVLRVRTDEILLIKVYDSARDGRARFVPHGSFRDPRAPADAPPRQSIETRVLALFD